jgi:hypothetical protein
MAEDNPILILPEDFGERDIWENEGSGCWLHVVVQTPDGRRFRMNFYTPIRIAQSVEAIRKTQGHVFFESNLVVLDDITIERVQYAINDLWEIGEFASMLPMPSD